MQEISKIVLKEKYLKDDEQDVSALFKRVANGVAQAETNTQDREKYAEMFYNMMVAGGIGAGRIMSAAGTKIMATLINCFVQPVGDTFNEFDESGNPGIFQALTQAAETMRRGGGVGYDFSKIRPAGAIVRGTMSEASGPCSYMDVFDMACKTVESAGARRGAQMGVLRIDHPDVMNFITAKRTPGRWNNFNVSLYVEDEFFDALSADSEWELVHVAEPSERFKSENAVYQRADGKWVYRKVRARELWDTVMKSNYDFAEPGILLGSQINRENNLWYCEKLEATNPCGEQNLPPYGCCDLGPLILPKFVIAPFTQEARFDWVAFKATAKMMVRFLDNVLDVTYWPLQQQEDEAKSKRRIGVGFTGLGSALAMMGIRYGTPKAINTASKIVELLRDATYEASVELARERGAFPLLSDEYSRGEFVKRLPLHIREGIDKYGIRNSHLLSIAPTGTVSLAFGDNCSNGIEPIFDLSYKRKKRTADGGFETFHVMDHALRVFVEVGDVADHVPREQARAFKEAMLSAVLEKSETFVFNDTTYKVADVLPDSFVTAQQLTVQEHLNMLSAVQKFVDSSISKTINVPVDYPFEDFKRIYTTAHDLGLKGVACYRPNDIIGAVLVTESSKADQAPAHPEPAPAPVMVQDVDPAELVLSKRPQGDLDAKVKKVAYSGPAGDSTMYVTVSFAPVAGVIGGMDVNVERPVEVFVTASPDGVPAEWVAAYARNLSLLARSGVVMLAKALQDGRAVRSDKGRVRHGWYEKDDGSKVPRFHSSEVALIAYAVQEILMERGVLDAVGNPVPSKVRASKERIEEAATEPTNQEKPGNVHQQQVGRECRECGAMAVIRKDGCDFCTNCGTTGSCG